MRMRVKEALHIHLTPEHEGEGGTPHLLGIWGETPLADNSQRINFLVEFRLVGHRVTL